MFDELIVTNRYLPACWSWTVTRCYGALVKLSKVQKDGTECDAKDMSNVYLCQDVNVYVQVHVMKTKHHPYQYVVQLLRNQTA